MRPRFQLRHQDYVLGPNQDSRLSSVAAGQMITGIELPMDNDAPFLERGRAYRVAYTDTTRAQAGLNGYRRASPVLSATSARRDSSRSTW